MAEGNPPAVPPAPDTLPWFTSVSWPPYHYELYQRVYKLMLDKGIYFNSPEARSQPPYKFKTPQELKQEVDFSLGEKGVDHEAIYQFFSKLIDYSPHRSHPYYLSKDGTGLDPYAILGDFNASILSTAVLTYLFAPVFTLQEFIVQKNIRKLIGYPNPDQGDGVNPPGGGFATSMAIAACLNYTFEDIREKGFGKMNEKNLAVFASEDCNDFVEKACIIAGLGSTALVKVKSDSQGRMNIRELRHQLDRTIRRGVQPVMVIATIGTDPLGAVDPIPEIASICEQYKLWFHVDGTYGGPLIMSDGFRTSRLSGIEKSHSFIFGGSGMLGAPWCSTTMVTPIPNQFFKSFGVGAEVVFEPTLLYDSSYDNGDHTIQTSRRPDIAKFWLLWKAKGRKGLAKHVEYCMNLAKEFNEEIKRRPAFHAILPSIDCTRVAFYYIPRQFRYMARRTDYLNYQMTNVSRKIKNKLLSKGNAYLSLSKVKGYPECFAVSITNSVLTMDDLKHVLDDIESSGKEVSANISYNPWLPPAQELHIDSTDDNEPTDIVNDTSGGSFANKTENSMAQDFRKAPPSFVNAPISSLHNNLFESYLKMIDEKGLYFQDKREDPLLCFRNPDELQGEYDLSLSDEPSLTGDDKVIEALKKMIRFSIHQAHPFYVYQLLSGGLDAYTIMADFMMTIMTSNCLTYEDAPFYTLIEEEVMRASRKRIGYPEDGDGMLTPGGSVANEIAITVARLALFPETRDKGLDGWRQLKLTLYTSANAHYCFKKGALLNGIGLENVVEVEPDQDGRMDIAKLRKAIQKTKAEGGTPFFVGATAGTTVLGVFDNLAEVSQVCSENGMWMHIDGSVGGAMMFSDVQLKKKLSSAHLADSFSFNPHKWFGVVMETALLLYKKPGIVQQTLGVQTTNGRSKTRQLWRKWFTRSTDNSSGNYDSPNGYGDLAAHSGLGWERRANIIKIWLLWKTKGIEGMGQHIDYTYSNRDFLVEELKRPERQEMFRLVKPEFECPGVCFYYLPLALRNMDENSEEYKKALESVPLRLQARLVRADVTITPVFRDNGSPLFTKFTILSSGINPNDIRYLLDAIDYYGRDLPYPVQ